jgi:wobble nucleotide-excising tRNase
MIKRITKIKNIGTFSNFVSSPPIQFEKLTFIYGLNTLGKTTLTDIFSSIKKDDFSVLESRKSIPPVTIEQQVEIGYKDSNSLSESVLKVQNGTWHNNFLGKNIEIFSSEFIHKNLFTGESILRENKENFTQFILGDSGVAIAQEIKNEKQNLNLLKRELPDKKPDFVKTKQEQELVSFIAIDITPLNLEELKVESGRKQVELNTEKARLLKPQLILSKPNPKLITIPTYTAVENIKGINQLLGSSFESISDEALAKVGDHISANFSNDDIAEDWLKTGNENIKENNCTFCGQNLSSVQVLIDSYSQFFNKEYNLFTEELLSDFSELIKTISEEDYSLSSLFTNELTKIRGFKELINTSDFNTLVTDLENLLNVLNKDNFNALKTKTVTTIRALFEQKKLKPHSSSTQFNITEFEECYKLYNSRCVSVNSKINEITEATDTFKKTYQNLDELREIISKKEIEITQTDYKIKRIEQNEQCLAYNIAQAEIISKQTVITTKEEGLSTNQTEYLTTYFQKISQLFNEFGSRNFSLEKSTNNRGHYPVYSLKVKFHGNDINENDFSKVFSESDKRALGLAVFWTKINMMNEEEKSNTILILDDPATSFDDNRVTKTIEIFKNSINQLAQVIVLTHYSNFLKIFFEKLNNEFTNIKFLELKKNNITSQIVRCNIDQFTKSEYQLTYEKITGFISGEHDRCIKNDLRKFIETSYIPHFYPHKLKQAKDVGEDISTLSKKIDWIFPDNNESKEKFHSFRVNTNPESHIYTSNNSEDVKNFANEMMTFLYSHSFSDN